MKPTLNQPTLLVVEDDRPVLRALVDKFTREGFIVHQASDGEEGLALALQVRPQLILLDVLMPKIDGLTMLKKLRAENVWGKTVPVILLTNLSPDNEQIMQTVTETEPAYYLVKTNWQIDDVVKKVREILNIPYPS